MAQDITQDKDYGTLAVTNYDGVKFAQINPYTFMREADNGTGGIVTGEYIIKHSRERRFEERKNYTIFFPHVQRIINAIADPIFAEAPKRDWDKSNALLNMFFENCDKTGNTWDRFFAHNARRGIRWTSIFFVVDNAAQVASTLGEAIAAKQHPYVYAVSPELVYKIRLDGDSNIQIFQFIDIAASDKDKTIIREIRADGWKTFDKSDKEETAIEYGIYTIGEIPVVPFYDGLPEDEENPALPFPRLYHIAKMCVAGVMNISSEMREGSRNQMFSVFAIPRPQGTEAAKGFVNGTGHAFYYDPKDGGKPMFVSPEADVFDAIGKDRQFHIDQISEASSNFGVKAMQERESGVAREIGFKATSQRLLNATDTCQTVEIKVLQKVGLFLQADTKFQVEYSRNYGLVDTNALIQETTDTMAIPGLGAKAKREALIDFVKTRFRNRPPEVLRELIKEAEQAAFDAEHAEDLTGGQNNGNVE